MTVEDRSAAMLDAITKSVRMVASRVPTTAVAVDVLEVLCKAAGVDRGYIYENRKGDDGKLYAFEFAQWCTPGIEPVVFGRRGHAYADWQARYADMFDQQGVVSGPVEGVGEPERQLLRDIGVRSLVAAPVYVGDRWWGFLGLHDCTAPREWTDLERRALGAAASVIGAAVSNRPPSADEGALQSLVEHVPAILYIDDLGIPLHSLYIGPQVEAILGISRATWLEDDGCWERNMHPDDWSGVWEQHAEYMTHGGRLVQEYRMIRPDDGRVVWIRDDCTTYPGVDRAPGIIQGVMTDVTEQKQLEEQLRASEARNRALIEQIPAVVYIEPLEGADELRFVSGSVETVFGVTREEWLGANWWLWHLLEEDRERVLAFRRELPRHSEPVRTEYRVVTDDGRVVWIGEIARVVLHDGRPSVLQGLMEDITQRRMAEQQIEFLAYHDVLTGLSNRVMFEDHLELAIARSKRSGNAVAVLYVDLDGLKRVNDTLGHQAGDQLLSAVARRLGAATREGDLVARHGGDEFLILLPDLVRGTTPASPDDAVATATMIAQRVCHAVREPIRLGETDFGVSASVGISVFPDDATDIRTLLRHADEAMYASKQTERGGVRVYGAD